MTKFEELEKRLTIVESRLNVSPADWQNPLWRRPEWARRKG